MAPTKCFCDLECNSYEDRRGSTWLTCGHVIDFALLSDRLKAASGQKKRDKIQKRTEMGCNMKIKVDDHKFLDFADFPQRFGSFPTCQHKLYAKVGVCHSEKNNNKPFYSCDAKLPNQSCGYFNWVADIADSSDDDSSDDDDERAPKRRRSNSNDHKKFLEDAAKQNNKRHNKNKRY